MIPTEHEGTVAVDAAARALYATHQKAARARFDVLPEFDDLEPLSQNQLRDAVLPFVWAGLEALPDRGDVGVCDAHKLRLPGEATVECPGFAAHCYAGEHCTATDASCAASAGVDDHLGVCCDCKVPVNESPRGAAIWDHGYTAGHSNAMRRMSDEPDAPTSPNPFAPKATV